MWKIILFNIAFAITCLLAFLLVFESGLSIPAWLQVFGRIHPLFLHIPIGLLLLYAITELFFPFRKFNDSLIDLKDGLLLVSAVTVSLTALMGLFLSKEAGYEPEAVSLHKWMGTVVCFLLLAWYQWRASIRKYAPLNKSIAVLSIVVITVTGHMGGNITHGENFVLGPILPKIDEEVKVPLDEAVVFRHMIQPILKAKCISCHNEKKAKGELIMETSELLLKGGKDGKLWDTAANDLGLLLKRVNLPLDHDDHMPPKGKTQLTDTEKSILEAWIRSGSNFTVKVSELPPGDTLKVLAAAMFSSGIEEVYTFQEANKTVVESLNNFYRIVKPIAEKSPALTVSFFGRSQFTPNMIQDLKPISTQVVEMDLSRMPVNDQELASLTAFPNLRKLILNFTDIKGTGIAGLKNLKFLRELSLSGTNIQASALNGLKDFPALKKVFVWDTPILPAEALALQKQNAKIIIESGINTDTMILKLTPPIFNNDSFVISGPTDLKLKHNINGTIIHYTLDGTEPDSIHSPVFNNDVKIDRSLTVKARAFHKGWISSDMKMSPFYVSTVVPKKVILLTNPNSQFVSSGERTLFDFVLGGNSVSSGKWLAYEYPAAMKVLLDFEANVSVSSVTLSCTRNSDRQIFAPQSISLWYGNDSLNLKKLETLQIAPPKKDEQDMNQSFTVRFPKVQARYIKLEAMPIAKLPQWHSQKGRGAWILVDEIAVN